jgi:hypothetical protein
LNQAVSFYNLGILETLSEVTPPALAGENNDLWSERNLASKQYYASDYLDYIKEIKEISLRIAKHNLNCPSNYVNHPLNPLIDFLHYNY